MTSRFMQDKAIEYWLLACLTFAAFMFAATALRSDVNLAAGKEMKGANAKGIPAECQHVALIRMMGRVSLYQVAGVVYFESVFVNFW